MKEKVLTQTVKHLFNTIDATDILREENGEWYFEDKPLNEATKRQLVNEAELFLKSSIWKILMADVKWQSNKRMFEQSKDLLDMTMGKSYLYVIDCMKTRLESMNKGKGIFNSKV